MSLPLLSVDHVLRQLGNGAVLIDIRDADEYARCHIAGAHRASAAQCAALVQSLAQQERPPAAVVFHCGSGQRTNMHADALARAAAGVPAYLLEGGIDAWKSAGQPVVQDRSQPLPLQRQVQLGAGGLVLLGAVLGFTVSPAWHALSGAVGAGLMLAGATGFCGMARLLLKAPWNRNMQRA